MGLSGMTGDELAAWVAQSCAQQGIPVKVTDVTVLRRVCALLGGPVGVSRAQARRARPRAATVPLQTPHDADPGPVDAAGSCQPWLDHDMINQRGRDGLLPVQVQLLPRTA